MSFRPRPASSSGKLVRGARKTQIHAIDTNLNSYDRTDPFLAFNVLLKLLGSLPSRIGGCQYKLAPEEHKLSLHLLSIVEPFVGLAPSKRTLTRQPTEILDVIVTHVDEKADLLSLALSCKRLHGVIIPRHLGYRTVRCKVSSIRVWHHLNVNRALARNVRRLEILDERANGHLELVPSGILASDTDLESTDDELGLHEKHERYFINALSKMTLLRSFVWSCNHSPISIDNVWPTLLKCGVLNHIEINDNLVFAPGSTEVEGDSQASSSNRQRQAIFRDVRTVALRATKHSYGSTKYPDFVRISGMLTHCPNLESLAIGYTPPRSSSTLPTADTFLLTSRWPTLTSLTLTNIRANSTDLTASFLASHPMLEVLHLALNTPGASDLVLLPGSLPSLRDLHAPKAFLASVLVCPTAKPRPLEALRGLSLTMRDQSLLNALSRVAPGVRRLELTSGAEPEDVRAIGTALPGLTWLDVGRRANTNNNGATVAPAVEWANVLTLLPELTAFHGVRFFYEVTPTAVAATLSGATVGASSSERSRVRKNEEIALVLAWRSPKLRRVDHWEEGKFVVLLRDAGGHGEKEKIRWEVRRSKGQEEVNGALRVQSWKI